MPASQIHELYKPSFSIPVSPDADLNATYGVAPGPENPTPVEVTPSSGTNVETPFNTEEIGPTSINRTGGAKSAPSAATAPGAVSSPTAAIAPSTPFDEGAGAVSPSGARSRRRRTLGIIERARRIIEGSYPGARSVR